MTMNREQIKYFAVLAMLLNHIALLLLPEQTVLYYLFDWIGHFTAPIMVFFIVEGYQYTRSKKKYATRLLLFACISQIPYYLAFHKPGEITSLNILFNLLLCFGILYALDEIKDPMWKKSIVIALVMSSVICDWLITTAVMAVFLYNYRNDKKKRMAGFVYGFCCYLLVHLVQCVSELDEGLVYVVAKGFVYFLNAIPILLAGIIVTYCYNGQKTKVGGFISKWFFYLFYPAHLMILVIIRSLI